MYAELISIGDELLIGQTVNTNSTWLGQNLSSLGVRVKWVTTISDEQKEILDAFDISLKRADLVIVTGGLGPTKDDITKHALTTFFETELVLNQDVLSKVEAYFSQRGRSMLQVNRDQALLPASCEVLVNNHGTASGMWFEKNGKVLISLPGVPYEMKGIMNEFGFEKIKNKFQLNSLYQKTILTTGIGESFLAELIKDWEDRLRGEGLSLAYLPSPGLVKLRVSSFKGLDEKSKVDQYISELVDAYPEYVFGEEDETLAFAIAKLALAYKIKIGTVESCTGGGVANAIISIPGSSEFFEGSLVTYSYDLKTKLANVQNETLNEYGAVSEEAVIEMANGGRENLNVDYCISISGIAGPGGGTEDKPVGTVWMAISTKEQVFSKKIKLGDNRERNIQMTIFAALNFLRLTILGKIE
jgi:nicotinamide-nucleotide amidase